MYFLTLSFHVADLFGLNVMRLALGGVCSPGSSPGVADDVFWWHFINNAIPLSQKE